MFGKKKTEVERGEIKEPFRNYGTGKEVKVFKNIGWGHIIAFICKGIFTLIFGLVVYLQIRKINKLSEKIGYAERKCMPSLWKFFNTEFKFSKFWRKKETALLVVTIPSYFIGFIIHNFYIVGISAGLFIFVIVVVAFRTASNYVKTGVV